MHAISQRQCKKHNESINNRERHTVAEIGSDDVGSSVACGAEEPHIIQIDIAGHELYVLRASKTVLITYVEEEAKRAPNISLLTIDAFA